MIYKIIERRGMENRNDLSAQYWALHRNSLLASSALFLACQVQDVSELKVFDVEFSSLGAAGIAQILAIGTIYCFIALVLEWKEEPQRIYRFNRDKWSDIRERLGESSNQLLGEVRKLENVNEILSRNAEYLQDGYIFTDEHRMSQDLHQWFNSYTKKTKRDFEEKLKTAMDENEKSRFLKIETGVIFQLDRISHDFNDALLMYLESNRPKTFERVASAIEETSTPLREIVSIIPNLIAFRRQLPRKVTLELASNWVRIVGFGIVLPGAIFATAIGSAANKFWIEGREQGHATIPKTSASDHPLVHSSEKKVP